MTEALLWLERSALGGIARESLYGFQILVGLHLLGLVLSVGILMWVDLRMLGLGLHEHSIASLHKALSKWFGAGFALMFVTGFCLFAGFATNAYENSFFRIKMAAIGLAGLNAIAFHVILNRQAAGTDTASPAPHVRIAGGASLLFWATAILCGRMMAYTLF